MVWTTKLSSKGQLVLPKVVRQKLGVDAGSQIVLAERQGRIEIHAYGGDILDWYGAAEVDGPQDWKTAKQEAMGARAAEVVREAEGD